MLYSMIPIVYVRYEPEGQCISIKDNSSFYKLQWDQISVLGRCIDSKTVIGYVVPCVYTISDFQDTNHY